MLDHTEKINIYYKDTDAGGVVYHSRYIEFMEIARTETFTNNGFNIRNLQNQYNILFPIVNLNVKYKMGITYGQTIQIYSKLVKIKPIRFQFEYIVKNENGDISCLGESINVCVDKDSKKPKKLPSEFFLLLKN